MSQLGKAYIEVLADLKKFPADLRTKLKAAMKAGMEGVEFTEFEQKAKAAGERAGDAAGEGFKRRVKKKTEDAGKSGGVGFLKGLGDIFEREKNSKGGFFESVSKLFSSATEQGVKGVSEKLGQVANIGGQVGSALSGIGGAVGSIVQVGVIAVLIPVIIQLAGAFIQLGAAIFALPAIAGVAVAAFAPLIIAFQGFGEAVSAGLSGDVDKFNQALKGLPSSMRKVVKEVVGLKSAFSGIKTGIQEAFFKPLVGVVGPAIRSFLATVGPGLTRIASALGNVGATLIRTFTSPENLRTFAALLATTDRVVQTMEPAVSNLAQALLNLIRPALPFIERGATAFRDFAAEIESFTRGISSNGTLTGWLDKSAHILKTLVGLAKDFGHYLLIVFGGEIGDNGSKFLDDFRVKLKELITFIQSPDGQEAIHNLATLLKALAGIFIWLIGMEPAALRFFNDFFSAVRAIGHFFAELGRDVAKGARAVGSFFVDVWNWIKSAGGAIGNFFTKTIPSWWDSVVSFFASLPDKVVAALRGFQQAGRDFLIDTLKSWYEQVFEWVGNVIGIIWSLPQLIPAIFDNLKTVIWTNIQTVWDGAVALFWDGVHQVVAVFESIPLVLAAAGQAIWAFVTDLWQRTVVDSYNTVAEGFHRVMEFFRSLPDRIRALGPALYLAAVQLGHKIGDGLANIGTFASDVGHKIVNTIKTGINWVIGSINRGIAEIDDKLPGTLPRIPMLARGAVVDSPTLALIGEAGPEVVLPLSNPKRAQELAQQSGLLSMLRGAGKGGATLVQVWLDPTGVLIPITKQVVSDVLDDEASGLDYARAA